MSVTHTLKPEVYDLPLTARTTIPEDWRWCDSGKVKMSVGYRFTAKAANRS